MSNPYEPLSSTSSAAPVSLDRSFFKGGFLTIAIIGLGLGAIVGALIFGFVWSSALVFIAVPAIGWWCATGMIAYLIRTSRVTFTARVLMALLLPIPAYILYVPVCGVVSLSTTLFTGGKNTGPTANAAMFGSVVAFFLVLMSLAAVVRLIFHRREDAAPTPLDEQF